MADPKLLVAGSTGHIGGLLSRKLCREAQGAEGSKPVRCLVRDPGKGEALADLGAEVAVGDVLQPTSLEQALEGVDVACYLVRPADRGSGGGYAERDRRGAGNFADAAAQAGVERIVYLGGLGEGPSEQLRSRHEVASVLAETGVPVTYLRAATVIGGGSEPFRALYYLTRRQPVMAAPKWTATRTQPIAAADVVDCLAAAARDPRAAGGTIELGGPSITTYGGMIDALADAMGARRPLRITLPLRLAWLSSKWIRMLTPVEAGLARSVAEELSTEAVVTDPSGMELLSVHPRPIAAAMRQALTEPGLSGAPGAR